MERLYYISQGENIEHHLQNIEDALNAGVRLVQLRLKEVTEIEYLQAAIVANDLCKQHGATFIVNDNPMVALNAKADGVHVGANDMEVAEVKKMLGPDFIVGGTANTFEKAQQLVAAGVDYLGVGPFRFTTTKKNLSPILGLEGYQQLIENCKTHDISTPIYAIGGILEADFEPLMKTGIYGIAVSGLITNAENKKGLINQLNKYL